MEELFKVESRVLQVGDIEGRIHIELSVEPVTRDRKLRKDAEKRGESSGGWMVYTALMFDSIAVEKNGLNNNFITFKC